MLPPAGQQEWIATQAICCEPTDSSVVKADIPVSVHNRYSLVMRHGVRAAESSGTQDFRSKGDWREPLANSCTSKYPHLMRRRTQTGVSRLARTLFGSAAIAPWFARRTISLSAAGHQQCTIRLPAHLALRYSMTFPRARPMPAIRSMVLPQRVICPIRIKRNDAATKTLRRLPPYRVQ